MDTNHNTNSNNKKSDDMNDDSTNERRTLNGAWKLDKTRGEPSLRGFLEAMCVSQLAIIAHEKGKFYFSFKRIMENVLQRHLMDH